jgi:8-amino-7-oxononanoate synthase
MARELEVALFDTLESQLAALEANGLRRVLRTVSSPCAPQLQVDGKPMLAFASNDYLGLAAHPLLVQALQQGAQDFGVGSGASHLISGHYAVHAVLERRLARMLAESIPHARALYFGCGYMANLATVTALAGMAGRAADGTADGIADCTIFSANLNHASLIDGVRLARCKVKVYPHAEVATLKQYLEECASRVKIVVTDGVFSMDGDLAPLAQILALCEQHQAFLIVDDAHGFGVLGPDGHGILQHFGLCSPNLVYMGTLGKAAGVGGAFVAADPRVIEWLIQRARPYIYTTAAAPALAQALLASLDIIESAEGRQRRAHLQALIAQWRQAMGALAGRWHCLPSNTAIQPLIVGSNEEALRVALALRERGLWVPAIRPPTVPAGTARLRVTLSSAHTHEQVQQLVDALQQLEPGA